MFVCLLVSYNYETKKRFFPLEVTEIFHFKCLLKYQREAIVIDFAKSVQFLIKNTVKLFHEKKMDVVAIKYYSLLSTPQAKLFAFRECFISFLLWTKSFLCNKEINNYQNITKNFIMSRYGNCIPGWIALWLPANKYLWLTENIQKVSIIKYFRVIV